MHYSGRDAWYWNLLLLVTLFPLDAKGSESKGTLNRTAVSNTRLDHSHFETGPYTLCIIRLITEKKKHIGSTVDSILLMV